MGRGMAVAGCGVQLVPDAERPSERECEQRRFGQRNRGEYRQRAQQEEQYRDDPCRRMCRLGRQSGAHAPLGASKAIRGESSAAFRVGEINVFVAREPRQIQKAMQCGGDASDGEQPLDGGQQHNAPVVGTGEIAGNGQCGAIPQREQNIMLVGQVGRGVRP